MTTITNFDIIDICRKLHVPLVGVFSKDKLPYHRKDGAYVVNMQDDLDINGSLNQGSHWVCFYIWKKQACYFDSFGIIAPRQIQEFLKPYRPYPYNIQQIQDIKTTSCGWYCIFFLYWFHHQNKISSFSKRLELFNQLFDKDVSKNKSILEKLLKKTYK